MVIKQSLQIGTRAVASVSVDPSRVTGEGGPGRPQLVVPLTIGMATRPEDAVIAVTSVTGTLLIKEDQTRSYACEPVRVDLLDSLPVRSRAFTDEHTVPIRFFLTANDIERIERARHASTNPVVPLTLAVESSVAAIVIHNGTAVREGPWADLGQTHEPQPFWRVDPIEIPIETNRDTWVEGVLPKLGYDRLRLIEITFPPVLPDNPHAAAEWDKARRALDDRRYSDCISECRDLLALWKAQLKPGPKQFVPDVIAERRRWAEDDPRRTFLQNTWKALTDLVNVPHHPEGQPGPWHFTDADARLSLHLTAALSEYVSD